MNPALASAPLSGSRWAGARWLVIAPHADDETIGAGALIVEAAAENRLAGVAFLTDGGSSHAHDGASSRRRLVAARRGEATRALRRLAPGAPAPLFLDWTDAAPPGPDDPAFGRALGRLSAVCRRASVDAVAVTALHEPHCDHAAACRLAYRLRDTAFRRIDVFEYLVWADAAPGGAYRALRTGRPPAASRRLALAAHRSQTTPLFGSGFRLPGRHLKPRTCDLLYVRSVAHGP